MHQRCRLMIWHAGVSEINIIVYAGHRSASKDALFSKEFSSQVNSVKYRVAYSRDGEQGKPRTYVQDLIEEDGRIIWKMLDSPGESKPPAVVFISG